MELRGQFSNHEARKIVDLAETAVTTHNTTRADIKAALSGSRQLQIKDRIDADELIRRFKHGVTISVLCAQFTISESSVKRLLRSHGARRY